METRISPSFLDSVKYIWIEWEIRSMVILSLLLQILLVVLGNQRKHSCSSWVGVVIWAAYLLSDSVATFSLGIISTAQTNSASLADKSIKALEAVMVFWAPFLLVHLGGPDTITAYSLEDNELWLRHLIGLLVQAGLVFYLLVLSWIRSSINNNPLQLPLIAIPVLISGLLKYGERIWVLWSASSERFRKSLLRPAQAGPDYAKLMAELRMTMNMGHPLRYGPNEEPPRINRLPSDVIPEAELLVTADQLFNIFKSLCADLILDIQDHTDGISLLGHRSCEDAFKVIEIELGFMYDMLYSKASAAHSLAGFVVRSISLMSSSAAFVAFCTVVDNHNFSHKNIIVTYLLLVGAVFLEIYAIVMLIFSERTLLRLKKKKKGYGNFLYRVISACPSASMNRKRWSGYMAQYNLIGFCVNDKPAQYEEIQRFFGIYESLEIARYKTWEKVTNELKQKIFAHIKRRTATASSPQAFKHLCSNRGDYTLRNKSCMTQFSWSVLAVEFDHSILLWHIATDLCYYSDLNRSKNIVGMEGTQVASKSSKKRKDPASTTRGHRLWKKVEEDMLIKTMRDVFKIKWKQDNGQFQPGFYAEVEKHIILAFLGTDLRANPHIASKIKHLRRQYNMLVDILRQSGFAWDDTLKMVKIDSQQVWEEYVSSHGEAKGMLNKPFPYYEDWFFLFGKDRATGEFVEGPVDAMAAIDLEEGESVEKQSAIDCDSVSMNGSPSNPDDNGKGKKRSRSAEGMAALVSMAEAMTAHLKETNGTMAEIAHRIGYDQDLSNARQRVYAELLPLGFDTHTRMKATAMIAKDVAQLDLFSGVPEEDKAKWVMLLLGGFFKEDK